MTKASGFLIIIPLIATLSRCSVAPSETTVEKAITDYFENGHYQVADLKLGKIKGIPSHIWATCTGDLPAPANANNYGVSGTDL